MSRVHLLALPHTRLTDDTLSCAYSQKVRRACGMLRAEGHHVTLYGPDEADVDADEVVVVHTAEDRARWGFEQFDTVLSPLVWAQDAPYFAETNARMSAAVRERARLTDLLMVTTSVQYPVAAANNELTVAEWTVGYEGIGHRDRWFAAFESYAWMHHVYGLSGFRDGRAFDRVIPNFFDPDDFYVSDKKDDYLLFVGRVILRKGPHIAAEIAERVGRRLVVAGPGARYHNDGLCTEEGTPISGDVEYVGEVGRADRAELMAKAACLITPTLFIEPFGGVAVEAMMSGTPVLASDWGAYTETVAPWTGSCFRTLTDAPAALDHCLGLSPSVIREDAVANYSLAAVGPRFTAWFAALDSLWLDGWYTDLRNPLAVAAADS
jgi:glycosyltransferase involved in cell wall biosynthesis